jgi:hypothetical protein
MPLPLTLTTAWLPRLTALLLTATTGTALAAEPAEPPRVLIIEPRPVVLPGLGQRALRNTVETVVRTNGAEVVPARRATAAGACETPACLRRTATEAKATHVFRVDGEYANEGYRLQLTLWVDATAQQLKGEALRCQICTATEMLAAAREQATALWAKRSGPAVLELTRPTPRAPDPDLTRPAPAAPDLTRPAPELSRPGPPQPPAAAPEARPAWKSALPWLGLVAGVASIATGAFLLSTDGECTDSACLYKNKRHTPGVASIGGGVAALGLSALGFYAWYF